MSTERERLRHRSADRQLPDRPDKIQISYGTVEVFARMGGFSENTQGRDRRLDRAARSDGVPDERFGGIDIRFLSEQVVDDLRFDSRKKPPTVPRSCRE